MEDLDSIQRREDIFNKLRISIQEYEELDTKCDEIYELRQNKRNERDHLKKLVDIMIQYDCCPTEAQLKYSDEIEEGEEPTYGAVCTDEESYKRSINKNNIFNQLFKEIKRRILYI